MRLRHSLILVLCCAPIALGCMWGVSHSAALGKTFKACVSSSSKAWKSESYSLCIAELQQGIDLCKGKQRELVKQVLPKAPKGWSLIREGKAKDLAWDVTDGTLGSIGLVDLNPMGRDYSKKGGDTTLRLRIMPESLMFPMLELSATTPGLLTDAQETVSVGSATAILSAKGSDFELFVPFGEKGILVATLRGGQREFLLDFVDAELVDRVAAVFSK